MGNYSKLIGSLVGGLLGLLGSFFVIPAEFQSPEFTAGITAVLAAVMTYVFPANNPAP